METLPVGIYFFVIDPKTGKIIPQRVNGYPEIYRNLKEGETDFPMVNGSKIFDGQNFACL